MLSSILSTPNTKCNKVVITARNEAMLVTAAEEIRAAGGEVSVFVGDVSKVRMHGTASICIWLGCSKVTCNVHS